MIILQAAHRMTRFPPHSAVLTTVKLTKPAYAQLVGQKFFPPKIFGHFKEREGSDVWRWRDTGMKLASQDIRHFGICLLTKTLTGLRFRNDLPRVKESY